MLRALLFFQDANNNSNAAIWIPIAVNTPLTIIGWLILWKMTSRPVKVVLEPQPTEKAKKTTARKDKDVSADELELRLIKGLPILLPIPIVEICLSTMDLYQVLTSTDPIQKIHLLLVANSTFWICCNVGFLIVLSHLMKTHKPKLPARRRKQADTPPEPPNS